MTEIARDGSLRRRIVAAFTLLAVAVCGCFATIGFVAEQQVEYDYLVEHRLGAMAGWQLARMNGGGSPAELPPGLAFHVGARMPAMLRKLTPGLHEIVEHGATWHVLVGTMPDGERYAAVDEVTDLERIEQHLIAWLCVGAIASVLLAMVLGQAVAGRVIAPVTALADAVRGDTLDDHSPALARDDELGVLGRAFAARTTELQRFLVRERLFTGDVSHELRTPLTVILGAVEVLQVRLHDRPDLLVPIERIRRTTRDTADRLAALLLLSRAPEAIDAPHTALLPLVEREIERCHPLLVGKPVEIVVEERHEAWVYARPELASMAISNLLRNACQYTEAGRVSVRLTPVALTIEDTGPGVAPDVREQLFERFVRGSDNGDGAGLGLAIVKRIVAHLGWSIEFLAGSDSPAGGGSRFVLRYATQGGRSVS